MYEECEPSSPVDRLLGHSGFGDSFGSVYDAASDNIQEVIYLVNGLMWNDATVCGERIYLKIVVRGLYERWKYLESESMMMSSVTLMCWEYMDTLLLTRIHHNHRVNVSWVSYLTGSNYVLCTHPRELGLSIKDRMCYPCTSCCMVI